MERVLDQLGPHVQRLCLVAARAGRRAKFFTAFLIEKSLSMDNIFVFVVIFRFFAVPLIYQYHVLYWGILGAIVMRLAFILAGVELIRCFDWVAPLFGVFLVYTGYKLARHGDVEVHPKKTSCSDRSAVAAHHGGRSLPARARLLRW